ncbi:periplasmic chaperone for outer membrane proteins Skp [Pseudooceanicola nitratireducens]|uniref:Periplasmic chaperone for outer membrane proteins Skp n=1 Tax=Pseudooceanicola nitratireducens TaxID=517719 RepID=A0A1I1M6Z6_9RHOB|nr:OmpH family outer membrane protein [Pseudooceanicola nitratireducens]SEI92513.1 Outer membrane protein (OmpH-like) [Pseudooceanicola nitratireducens]SFC78998.1 periplasmic chaperone for outer membrane proteins Skp [Pseudooceanicola nitratireducens]
MRAAGPRLRGAAFVLAGVLLGLPSGPVLAQTAPQDPAATSQPRLRPTASPILVLDSERLLSDSATGQAIDAQLADRSAELAAENRRIEAELTEEEKDLTTRRATLSADAFRAAAAAFDDKVQTIREEQDAKLRALQDQANTARREILSAANPVLVSIMQEAGAVVVVEKASLLASLQAIDVTALAIARLDRAMAGDTSVEGGFDLGTPDPSAQPSETPAQTSIQTPVAPSAAPNSTAGQPSVSGN